MDQAEAPVKLEPGIRVAATSDIGVSSPPLSSRTHLAVKHELDTADEVLTLSSPSAGSRSGAVSMNSLRIKAEPGTYPIDTDARQPRGTIVLSSDPVDLTSEPEEPVVKRSSQVRVKQERSVGPSADRRKTQKRPSKVLEEDEGVGEEGPSSGESERAQQVVASWKSKFMMKTTQNKVS